jgi:hypothetical protein
MVKSFTHGLLFVISIIVARFKRPKKSVKEVVNVKYPVYKKAS